MTDFKDLEFISKYAGERFDLVQAAGGNTSVKLSTGEMLIKASGYTLSEVTTKTAFSTVDTKKVASIVSNQELLKIENKRKREEYTSSLMKEATVDKNNRPSIETLLHSLLLKYTLHTHPIVVNMIVSQKNYEATLHSIFPDDTIAIVNYETPGIELALKLNEEIQKFESTPKIIFLQNHGLIITSNNLNDIIEINEMVVSKIEHYLDINLSKFKHTNAISKLVNAVQEDNSIAYLSQDQYLLSILETRRDLFNHLPCCPDTLVYCGITTLELDNVLDSKSLSHYKEKYYEIPKVIICKNQLFLIAASVKKAREMEDVLKFHLMILEQNDAKNMNFLSSDEMAYLSNWEAEKFRQNL